jgi:hypothetical protein
VRQVPLDWDAAEEAFRNNAPEVHSYVHVGTGDVLRLVDGQVDPGLRAGVESDFAFAKVHPVSSREQFLWMNAYISLVEDAELRTELWRSLEGKRAFRRFKDLLSMHPQHREGWLAFRRERVRDCIEAWLDANSLRAVRRPGVSTDDGPVALDTAAPHTKPRAALRQNLSELAEALDRRELAALTPLGEFLLAGQRS